MTLHLPPLRPTRRLTKTSKVELVTSRVEIPATGEAGHHELLELAAAVQRGTARFLENLEQASRGEGDDPRCNHALALLETNLTGATQRILRKAHVLRYEMTSTRLRTEQARAQAPTPEPAAARLDSSRVETGGPAAAVLVPAGPAAGAGPVAAAGDETGAAARTPAGRSTVSPPARRNRSGCAGRVRRAAAATGRHPAAGTAAGSGV
ncbi:hypothetical protein AB0F92_40110 [Kitasatospora aureofaciens]|uniref:hypothetical protein n=1 Tax=Kitasatospora aureofaciens TaxID=1894 RepID=UPI0033D9A9A2